MVVLSVSLCSKQGKTLFSRQYVSMSKLRVETLLTEFIQIISTTPNQEKQHRFIDRNDVRYLYKSFEEMYLLIITNKESNLLNDLNALETIRKLISNNYEYIDDIKENVFNLLYSIDEVINPMGSIEQVNIKQIKQFVEMESAEEKLSEMICRSKIECSSEIMKKKCAEMNILKKNKIGLSIGGAMNVCNFRECINKNIIPSITSITYNGLLNEYYFDTTMNNDEDIKEGQDDGSMLFYPSYCYAKIKKLDFLNINNNNNNNKEIVDKDEYEYFMSVGLNSNIDCDTFKRKKLNMVIVLDKSGSMTLEMHRMSYQDSNNSNNSNNSYISKMETANKAIIGLLKHLNNDDRIGIITFENKSECIQKLDFIKNINMNKLKNVILDIMAEGGTNFECGYNAAINLYESLFNNNIYNEINNEYENHIIIITDARPNIGRIDPYSLMNMISKYAENGINDNIYHRIYTTFIGVGLDFNVSLIDKISNIRGCNYYSVNSVKQFMETMDQDFEYMVTPLVFNVCLKINCEGNICQIDKVYGSKDANNIIKNGEITKINTLFPSKRSVDNGEIKGGIQLIKLKRNNNNNNNNNNKMNVEIQVIFEDRNGKKYENKQIVTFESKTSKYMECNDMIEDKNEFNNNYYDNTGIRKAILLCKYAELLRYWIKYQNHQKTLLFPQFIEYFKNEMNEIKDDTLQKEVDILHKIMKNDINTSEKEQIDLIDAADLSSDLSPIEIFISEKLFVTFDIDGAMKKFQIKGDLEIAVNDINSTKCVIETNINPSNKLKFGEEITWRLHPRMSSSEWKKGILCLKNERKQFRVGRTSKTSILKWRITTNDEDKIPISIEFWPESESNGTINVNAQYYTFQALKNVIITFPTPSNQKPEILNCDNGNTTFYRNDGEFQWILNDLNANNEGSLEYVIKEVIDNGGLEDLYPISVYFEIDSIYSQIQIENVHHVNDKQECEYNVNNLCVAERYLVQS